MWRPVGQHFVQQGAQRIDIATGSHRFAAGLLGRNTGWSEPLLLRRRDLNQVRPGIEQFGNAEVENFRFTFGRYQNVAWLEIAMNDPVSMRPANRRANLQEKV